MKLHESMLEAAKISLPFYVSNEKQYTVRKRAIKVNNS